jgi:formylglycine-generating enzyme required for sulfatase activity
LDGDGRNGTFTEAFLQHIKKPNLELDSMYKAVARSVTEKSKNKQLPYKEGTNVEDFYFAGTSNSPTPGRQAPVIVTDEAEGNGTVNNAALRERESWDAVKSQTDAESFRIYLEAYPNGANAAKAKIKLEQIVWDSVKSSNDKSKIQNYLREFPNGANSTTARIKLQQFKARETPESEISAEVEESPVEEPLPTKVKPKVEKPKVEKSKLTPAPTAAKKRGKTDPSPKNEVRTNSVGMELVNIPAGSFMMGLSPSGFQETLRFARKEYADEDMPTWFDNEKPQRKVTFNDGFWMGKTEVTQAQWAAVMGESHELERDCDDCPIKRVSWKSVKAFIQKLNERNDGFEYRLPSEAEWEYAARGGTTGLFAGPIDEMAWHMGNAEGKTHPVGLTRPNAYGLFDMYGNVEEWCEDIYSANYEGLPVDGSPNTEIGEKKLRVIRGGSWNNYPTKSRSTARNSHLATSISATIGFRVAARLK